MAEQVEQSDIFTAPPLKTIGRGVIVQRPIAESAAPTIGPLGGVSIGAAHLPTVGAVVHVAVHHPDGGTLCLTLGRAGFREFALAMNAAAERIQSGDLDRPETRQ